MKIGLYLENGGISGVDLSHPWRGNPGIGGTEFNFVTLAQAFADRFRSLGITPTLYANNPANLPKDIRAVQAPDCLTAVRMAESDGATAFLWRPTVRPDTDALTDALPDLRLSLFVWAHNTPRLQLLRRFAESDAVAAFVPVGIEQARLIGEHPIQMKTTVISNGFHNPAFAAGNVEKDSDLIVYLGAMIPVKGFGVLARAWPRVVAAHPAARLAVIGSARLYRRENPVGAWGLADERFEADQIRPHLAGPDGRPHPSISFLGVLGTEKIALMRRAGMGVVNPSGRGENCPGSAIEFLAAGTPVVSIAREGLLDVVTHEKTGLLGTEEDDLAENLLTLLNEPGRAAALGAEGPADIAARFNYDKICAAWADLLTAKSTAPRARTV
ncbi:glycosyltransferase family 4 protein [Ruegeria faecimaris]|uniref:glycosyltransferase family 4 protein n=1 Tax=Ruegeria faecimaris TaxID=686389 RepID=UPI00249144F7|nr:glycosyltransferase family 4 protein [Ruegeria faecimaris]